jgi:hypothetical protein
MTDLAKSVQETGANVVLNSAHATLGIDTRGAEIRWFSRAEGPNCLQWATWESPVPATEARGYGTSELDWLSHWRGGWQVLFPNAGAASEVDGVSLPFHGEASTSQWTVIEQSEASASMRTDTRLPVTLSRTVWLDTQRPVLHIEETATNRSDEDSTVLWGQHPAFLARAGHRVRLKGDTAVVPPGFEVRHADLADGTYPWPHGKTKAGDDADLSVVPQGATERVVYIPDVREGVATVAGATDLDAIAIAWDIRVFPHVWMWTEIGGIDFPWHGRSRVIAVEPASSWPSDGLGPAQARGQGVRVPAHGSTHTWMTVALFPPSSRVPFIDREGIPREW